MKLITRSWCTLGLLFVLSHNTAFGAPSGASTAPEKLKRPKLLLVMVIDQFRADYLARFENRFLPPVGKSGELGGFRYLMEKGAYYPYAEYEILQSMTGPGHATVLTGSYPYQAGIPVNYWYDPAHEKKVYCTEDPAFAVVGSEPATARGGTSPKNLFGSTVGDELKNAGYPSRVVTLALKDRAAILMGGHRPDLAFWLDHKAVQWVSSKYYLPEGKLPAWLAKLNEGLLARKGSKIVWDAVGAGNGHSAEPGSTMSPGDWWGKNEKFRSAFPHETVFGNWESFATPVGIEITAAAAQAAFDAYQLGRGKSTDLLAVSFSAHDYGAHVFGVNSREMEEMTVVEDKVISGFLNHVRKKMPGGLKDVVVVLTADHGAPASPEWLKAHQFEAGRIDDDEVAAKVNERLNRVHGKPVKGDWVTFSYDMNFYLNRKAAAAEKVELPDLEREAKKVISEVPGVAYVLTGAEYQERRLPPEMFGRQASKTFMPGRSGDLVIIPKPFFTAKDDAAAHMTGYAYDRTVPLILSGFGIRPGIYAHQAKVVDLAPTLTFLARSMPPAASEGRVLHEALSFVQK